MMARPRPSLATAKTRAQVSARPAAIEAPPAAAKRTPSREGKRGVTFWLAPEAFKQLRVAIASEDRTAQAIMEEALDLWFRNRGLPRLATDQRKDAA